MRVEKIVKTIASSLLLLLGTVFATAAAQQINSNLSLVSKIQKQCVVSQVTPVQKINPNKLPICPSPDLSKKNDMGAGGRTEKWTKCWGKYQIEITPAQKGSWYEGEWNNGTLSGNGSYVTPSGRGYSGEFKHGKKHGLGVEIFDGSQEVSPVIYIGEFKNDKKNGQGVAVLCDGYRFEGIFKNDNFLQKEKINLPIIKSNFISKIIEEENELLIQNISSKKGKINLNDYSDESLQADEKIKIEEDQVVNQKNIEKYFWIRPIFKDARGFSDGLAAVAVDAIGKWKWGFINFSGDIVIEPIFDEVGDFSEGLAAFSTVSSSRKIGFINKNGEVVIRAEFDYVGKFSNGRAYVYDNAKSKAGYIDNKGKLVINYSYENIQRDFSDGVAIVKSGENKKYFFLDLNGEKISNKEFDYLGYYSGGLAAFKGENGRMGYVNKYGEIVIDAVFNYAGEFSEGLAPVEFLNVITQDSKWGFINVNGKLVIPPSFIDAVGFSDGLASVLINGKDGKKWGFINQHGEMKIEPKFSKQAYFFEGYARVCTDQGRNYQLDILMPFNCGFIEKKGRFVIAPEGSVWGSQQFNNGFFVCKNEKNGLYGFIRISENR